MIIMTLVYNILVDDVLTFKHSMTRNFADPYCFLLQQYSLKADYAVEKTGPLT